MSRPKIASPIADCSTQTHANRMSDEAREKKKRNIENELVERETKFGSCDRVFDCTVAISDKLTRGCQNQKRRKNEPNGQTNEILMQAHCVPGMLTRQPNPQKGMKLRMPKKKKIRSIEKSNIRDCT